MLQCASKTGLNLRSAFACGALAAAALLAGCSGESGTPTPAPSPAAANAAKPDANKPTTAATTAPAAAPSTAPSTALSTAPAKAVADAARKVPDTTLEAGKTTDAAKDAAKTAAATQAALGAAGAQAKVDATKADAVSDKERIAALIAEKQKNAAAAGDKDAIMAKAKADAAAGKLADPTAQDVDPNSKARLTYEFGSDTKNFGKVMQGDVLNTKFAMISSGEEDLVIKQAKPTCGCTVAQIMAQEADGTMTPYQFGKPVPPNRKVEISATLHTQNKRGHAGSKINIFTNDPRGQTILSLEAEVDPFFDVNPPNINFNTLSAKDTATDKLTIHTTKGDKVKLTAVKDNMPAGLKIELKPQDADADGKATRWEMEATAGPGLNEGQIAFSVPLKSDMPIPGGEKMPNGQVPTYETTATVMARVTGAISYNPQFVSLGLIRPGQALSRSVRITSHDAEFKLTDPKVSIQGRDTAEWEFAKYFTPVVRPVAGENSVDVEVTLNGMPESLSGSFSGMLVIQLGHPEKPEIKLPITGVCRGGAATGNPAPTPVPVTNTPVSNGTPPK